MTDGGFPHSDIHGSKPACGSPWLFAAYHVLHRLLVPRHSPYALSSLTSSLRYFGVCCVTSARGSVDILEYSLPRHARRSLHPSKISSRA